MPKKQTKSIKAIYFDLNIKSLERYYSSNNPKNAYRPIKNFLLKHNFSHVQYSGYHSNFKTTDISIFDLIEELDNAYPWLKHCVQKIEVTNVGANHDLMEVLATSAN